MLKKSIIILIILIIIIITWNKNSNIVSKTSNISTDYNEYNKNEYIGYLQIPVINMNLGFYDYDSPFNDVEYNIEFINTNIEETYLIAGHSGIGKKAYFNDLNKLKKDDDVYLKFKDKIIHYKVIAITSVIKTGEIEISNEGNLLYLTTCDQIIDGYQLIIIAKKV